MGFASGFAAGVDLGYKKRLLELQKKQEEFQQQLQQQKLGLEMQKVHQKAYEYFGDIVNKTQSVAQKNVETYNKLVNSFRENFIKFSDPAARQMLVNQFNKQVEALNNKANSVIKTTTGLAKRLGVDDQLVEQFKTIVPQFPYFQVEETKDGKFLLSEVSPDGQILGRYETDWDNLKAVYSPSSQGTSEFERELDSLLKSGAITKEEYYQFLKERVTKLTQPAMAALYKDLETMNTYSRDVTQRLGIEQDKLATIDIRKLPEEERARLQDLAYVRIRALKPKMPAKIQEKIDKIRMELGQIGEAFDMTAKMLERGDNVNVVGKFYRETIGKYLGMPLSQYEKMYRDSRFKGAVNVIRHALFGSALTKNEKQEFLEYVPSLYSTNKTLVLGMKSMIRDKLNEIESLREHIGYTNFNLLYGDVYRNLKELDQLISKAIRGKKPKQAKPVVNLTQKYLGKEQQQETQEAQEPAWKKYLK